MTTTNLTLSESPEELNSRYADQFLPLIIFLAAHAVIGIVGNFVVIMVFGFGKEFKNTTFKVFVLSLAAIDILSCLTFIPTEIARLKHFYWKTDDTLCKFKCFFNVFFNTVLAMTLFFIAFHRYRKVCQPFKKQIGPAMALRIVIVAVLVSGMLSVPAPIMCGIQTANKTNIYNTSTLVHVCAAETSIPKAVVLANVITITLLLFIVSVALIVIYVLISKTLFSQWRKVKSFNMPERTVEDRVQCGEGKSLDDGPTAALCSEDNITHETGIRETEFPKDFATQTESGSKTNENTRPVPPRDIKNKMTSPRSGKQYKTLIWLFLTVIFIVTNVLYVMAAFAMSKTKERSPNELFGYKFLIRIYFFNNIINPIVYAWLDRRFRVTCKNMLSNLKTKICRC